MPAPRRDFAKIRVGLEDWLAGKLPAARELRVGELTGPGLTGFSSDTFLFQASWLEDGAAQSRGLVARMPPSGMPVFPQYDIARQYRIQHALAGTAVPLAGMLWLEEDPGVLGAPFYVMEQIAGRTPSDSPTYHTSGWVAELEPAEREAMWWSGLRALADVHGADWRGLGLGSLDVAGDPLEQHIAEYEHMLAWSNGKPQPNLESALRWVRAHRPPPDEPRVLCWGDSRLGNMIFQDSRCAAVLDWEMARIGSPEADLAWWIYMDRHHSEGAAMPRLAGLPGRSETVARYEEWTGHRVRHLEYYEVFAALRFAIIMIRVGQQLEHYGFLPKDSGFEVNNSSTQLLARLLGLPAPG